MTNGAQKLTLYFLEKIDGLKEKKLSSEPVSHSHVAVRVFNVEHGSGSLSLL